MRKLNALLLCMLCITVANAQSTRAQRLRARYITPVADDNNRVWIMAHRGVWDEEAPESSLKSFQNAVKYRFEILELDVRFSAPYNIVDGVQVADPNGVNREVILQHDKSDTRSMNGRLIPGLYKYGNSQTFDDAAKKKNKKSNLSFVMLDKLVPYRDDRKNCISENNGTTGGLSPVLLKLDGTPSAYRMLHFPKNATVSTNADFAAFYAAVKDSILLNFDKLSDNRDYQETYDLMNANGLLPQCIFKAKGLANDNIAKPFSHLSAMFGNRDLSQVMFTPIFTKYDFITEKADGTITHHLSDREKLEQAIKCVDSLLKAEQEGKIIIPGAEIVYETGPDFMDQNIDENFTWLAELAYYVKGMNKRVVQFSTNLESKEGAWSGNGNFWSPVAGINVNYWEWLFHSSETGNIRPSVFVGDKPLELRSYLNNLRYNQQPIQ